MLNIDAECQIGSFEGKENFIWTQGQTLVYHNTGWKSSV